MTDLHDLERRISAALDERARTATPPTDAWDRIAAELGGSSDRASATVIDPEPPDRGFDVAGARAEGTRTRRRVLVTLAAALLVAVVAAIALRSADDRGGAPADTPPTEPAPEELEMFEPGTAMYGVVSDGSMLVAVGTDAGSYDRIPDPTGSAAVWTSTDGVSWTRVPHDEANLGGPGGQAMWDVTIFDGTFVAVGIDVIDRSGPDWTFDAAVWTSEDGRSWTQVPDPLPGSGSRRLWSVAASGERLLAVGIDTADQGAGRSNEDTAVWSSNDGRTWERVGVPFGTGTIESIVSADGAFVGIGVDNGRTVWTTVDGTNWTKTVAPGPENPLQLMRSARLDDRYVGVDFDGELFESPDGFEWSRVGVGRDAWSGTVYGWAVLDDEVVAVGVEGARPATRAAVGPLWAVDESIASPIDSASSLIDRDRWSLIARLDPADDLDALAGTVAGWEGVVDVAPLDASGADWESYGLDACDGDAGPRPCRGGLVVLTASDDLVRDVAARLATELGADAVMHPAIATTVVDEYIASVTADRPASVFEPTDATEQPLSGPLDPWEEFIAPPQYSVIVQLHGRNGVFWIASPMSEPDLAEGPVLWLEQSRQADEMHGRGTAVPVVEQPERGLIVTQADDGFVAIGGLPAEAVAVVAENPVGRRVWQRPVGGLSLLDVGESREVTVTVFDDAGNELATVRMGPEELAEPDDDP